MMMMNFFVVWLTDERSLALFPAGTIVRDPHHLESPTRRDQDLNLPGFVEYSCAVVITTKATIVSDKLITCSTSIA